MPTLRKPELIDPINPIAGKKRLQKLKDLVCGGPWGNQTELVLIHWKAKSKDPNDGEWVAWVDGPAPKVEPLGEAGVSVAT